MKNRKRSIGVFLFATLMLFMAGCTGSSDIGVLPTLAPTHTPAPIVDTPVPTVAPDAEYTKIIELNGEDFNQTSHFRVMGEGAVTVKPIANTGSYSFYMSGRTESWHYVVFDVADKEGTPVNVIGKNMYMAVWVYHETGSSEDFTCSLQIKKPDGTTDVPVTLTKRNVPSNTWTLIQGMLPVYANVTEPLVRIEMTSGKEAFYFDDLRLTYDETSSVAAKKDYNVISFDGLYFDFEKEEHDFISRGGVEQLTVENGGMPDGEKCLVVSNRSKNWHGPSIDLSGYGLAGTTIWIKFAASHDGDTDKIINCTMEEVPFGAGDNGKATYSNIVSTAKLAPGEWGEVTAKYTVKANSEKAVLYFETDKTEDIRIDNVLITAKDPATVEVDKETGKVEDKVERIDTTGFEVLYTLSADGLNDETATFISNGNATIEAVGQGHSENCFKVSNRTAVWNGVGIPFERDGYAELVTGKQVYVSYWVYQDSGKPVEFCSTLQANKPDGTAVWPERVAVPALPSGEWTYVEGMIPIYANVNIPRINFEIPSSADAEFYLDDIVIAYDPNSDVPPNKSYAEAEKENQKKEDFETLTLNFEDNNAFFVAKGEGKPSIVYGGYNSDKCLFVSGRTSSWHGVTADFSKYDVIGKTVDISFWLYHEYDEPLEVILSAEQNDGASTTYANIVRATGAADGKWQQFSGSFFVPDGLKKIFFYFESQNATAEFYLDDIVFEVE